jgi:phosphomannomutase
MNRAVVGRTAAGIAQYMKKRGFNRVVIGRDARHGSYEYAIESAEIFSGAGCEVFLLPRALPTPVLAYATKALSADIGIMVTASHNPPADNGYKVYVGPMADGISYTNSQIITPTDGLIAEEIRAITELSTQPRGSKWSVVTEEIIEEYIARTATLGSKPGSLKIVYTAMHGVGTQTLTQVFEKAGFPPLILVAEQSEPDPDFPTVAFPNPEEPGAIDLAISTARAHKADLVIANDPDADRCAAAIKERDGQWRMLRGDELGVIFGEWIARTAPTGTFGNSIVSSSILRKISAHYGISYEEAIGYAVDSETVNDKDGISAALLLAQIATTLAEQGKDLNDLLDEVWARHGFHGTEQISIRVADMGAITALLTRLRTMPPREIAGRTVESIDDLAAPTDGLPPTDGIRIWLSGGIRIIIRPSGTEAKLKCYIEVISANREKAEAELSSLRQPLRDLLGA